MRSLALPHIRYAMPLCVLLRTLWLKNKSGKLLQIGLGSINDSFVLVKHTISKYLGSPSIENEPWIWWRKSNICKLPPFWTLEESQCHSPMSSPTRPLTDGSTFRKETTPHFWHFWSQINSRFSCDHPICITVRGFTVGKRRIEGSIFLTPNGMMSNSNYYGVNYLAHANPTEMTPEVGK